MSKESNKFRKYLIFCGVFLLFLQLISFPLAFTFQCNSSTVPVYIPNIPEICSENGNCSYNWSSKGFLPWNFNASDYYHNINYTVHIDCPTTKDYRCENNAFKRTGQISGADFSLNCHNYVCQLYIKPHEQINPPIAAFVYLGSAVISLILGFIISLKYKSWWGIIFILFPIILFILSGLFTPIC